jgi:cytosine/uracil/thiamine/allantoin permease
VIRSPASSRCWTSAGDKANAAAPHTSDALHNQRTAMNREKAVSREKAQKAQKQGRFALAETFTEWVKTVSTPSLSFCDFCAFSRPSTAVFGMKVFMVIAG